MPILIFKFKQFVVSIRDMLNPKVYLWLLFKIIYKDQPFIIRLFNGLKIRTYSFDVIGEIIYKHGVFEPREVAFVTRFLKQGMVFLDIGANLGQYTLVGAHCVGKTGRVHSFEPSERMFNELEFNVKLNSLSDICFLNKMAVSDTNSVCQLSKYEAGAEVYGSLGSQQWAGKKIIGYEDVNTIRIDDYLQKNDVSHVDLIKMDIEGAELLALKGCEQLLSQPNSSTIILEIVEKNTLGFGYHALEIINYLDSFGYSFFELDKKGSMLEVPINGSDFSKGQNLVAVKNLH